MPACPSCSSEITLAQRFCPACGAGLAPSSQAGTVAMTAGAGSRLSRTSSSSGDLSRWPPGTVLAQRYRIAGQLGRGGMGEVYRAYDLILTQDVALKFLPASFAASEAALERFRNEVRLARQVSHPNVCRVYDIGEVDGSPFLSMEYVDGEDLSSLLRRIGRLPSDKALDLARRLCAGLAAAHEKGVIHRDLKPGNVMIDGRGEALITDFGLAALTGTLTEADARQGTPAYMAPEQLSGSEVTAKSDIYALGLVLYEMFTGRRAFEAATVEELARMQRESTPASVASLARDVDPAVERAILRCLAPDPRRRPASAKAVALALPGGDPLAAAIAAGETPSPEMVANAEETGGLRPAIAATVFASAVVLAVAFAMVSSGASLLEKTPFEFSPDALSAMARDHARRLGYAQRPASSASGLESSTNYLEYARSHFSGPRFQAYTAAGQPAPLTFWYRQSPGLLDPGADQSAVSLDRPASDVSGMYRMRLDLEGRLLMFEAVPKEVEPTTGAAPAPDWKAAFAAAALDVARFESAEPQWTPAMAFDTRAAWTGAWPGAREIPLRVEAAAWRGKLVSFRIVEPWTKPARDQPAPWDLQSLLWMLFQWFLLFPTACFLAWRNLKLNRGDREGAARLGLAILLITLPAGLLYMSHTAGGPEATRLFFAIALGLTAAVFVVVLYLALEPFVRRRYPHLLIAWTRLLQGGWRDPLLAANVLVGLASGFLCGAMYAGGDLLKARLGIVPALPTGDTWTFLLAARNYLGSIFFDFAGSVQGTLLFVFLFFLVRLALRKDILAAAAMVLIGLALNGVTFTYAAIDVPVMVLTWALWIYILLRFGIPASIAFLIVVNPPYQFLTLDTSRWYFNYSLAFLLSLVALAALAFRFSLGGRKLLNDETLG